nr:pro-sigmaK processing inhibitor BofA family protein [Lysinibacillus timonensis]
MLTYITVGIFSVLLIFSILISVQKIGLSVLVEKLAILWFKLACSFAILYFAHIIADGYNIVVPVNLFSALTITILGIPGMLCIGVITIFQ